MNSPVTINLLIYGWFRNQKNTIKIPPIIELCKYYILGNGRDTFNFSDFHKLILYNYGPYNFKIKSLSGTEFPICIPLTYNINASFEWKFKIKYDLTYSRLQIGIKENTKKINTFLTIYLINDAAIATYLYESTKSISLADIKTTVENTFRISFGLNFENEKSFVKINDKIITEFNTQISKKGLYQAYIEICYANELELSII